MGMDFQGPTCQKCLPPGIWYVLPGNHPACAIVLALVSLAMMTGFNIQAACCMAGMMPRKRGDVWIYPKSREVLKAVGLCTVEHSNGVRRQTVAKWIVHSPCLTCARKRRDDSGLRHASYSRKSAWNSNPQALTTKGAKTSGIGGG